MQCMRVQEIYFCPHITLYKISRKNSLTALHDQQLNDIHDYCPITLTDSVSNLVAINDTTYIITETKEVSLEVVCPRHQPMKTTFQGSIMFSLEQGCSATTPHFVATRPFYGTMVVSKFDIITTNPWPMIDPIVEDETFGQVTDQLLSRVGQNIDVAQVRGLVALQQKLIVAGTIPWVHGIGIVSAAIETACMVVAVWWGLRYWRRRTTNLGATSSSMPPIANEVQEDNRAIDHNLPQRFRLVDRAKENLKPHRPRQIVDWGLWARRTDVLG